MLNLPFFYGNFNVLYYIMGNLPQNYGEFATENGGLAFPPGASLGLHYRRSKRRHIIYIEICIVIPVSVAWCIILGASVLPCTLRNLAIPELYKRTPDV
jgi:hypothetical protein